VGRRSTTEHGIALPADEVLAGEFDALARALCMASSEQLIGKRWRGACSSTELMADVFTLPKLYECCPNYLYLYQHCALKGVPEVIVEGMRGVWGRCARTERQIFFEAGVQEAVTASTGMHPSKQHADANDFLERALSFHFKGASWHFAHTSAATTPPAEQSLSEVCRSSQSMGPSCLVACGDGGPLRRQAAAALRARPGACLPHAVC
jgi:hypothetical protein